MIKNKLTKTQIIVKRYSKIRHDSLVTIAWKKVGRSAMTGDYIVIPANLVPELIDKLTNLK